MAKIWRNLLIKGENGFSDVPQLWQAQVKVLLKADVKSGLITAEKYQEIAGEPYVA